MTDAIPLENLIDLIGDENGETTKIKHKEKEITITRTPPAFWKCKRCGNVYRNHEVPFICECRSKDFDFEIKDRQDLLDFYEFNEEYFAIQMQSMLKKSMKDLVTELIADVVKSKYPFYTTRHDDLQELWTYENGIYVPNGKTFVREYSRKILGEKYTAYLANIIINKIEADTYVSSQEFFSNNIVDEMPVENGLLNLKTKELNNFNPKRIHFIKIPVTYNPKATCPKVDDFLHEILPDDEDVQTAYELIGYCLWKTYKLEKAAVFLGDGSNGKDTLLELIKRFLGAENTMSIPLSTLEKDAFAEAELFQKLANIAAELSKSAIREDSKFKAITGRSQLSASRKFKEKINFVNFAKQMFAANSLPKVDDLTDGFWRRWIYIQFPYKFETQEVIDQLKEEGKDVSNYKLKDTELLETICTPEEFSGLLNKAIDAINKVWHRKAFTSSKSHDDTAMFWVRKSDSFLAFALENIEQNPDGFVTKESVRKAYQRYCKKNVVSNETDKHIAKIMQTHFGAMDSRKIITDTQEYVWEGVQLKEAIV